jgi:hypothetical protein
MMMMMMMITVVMVVINMLIPRHISQFLTKNKNQRDDHAKFDLGAILQSINTGLRNDVL